MIEKKQLAALFACGLIGWTVAQGLLALLPIYAARLGADPASAGNYLGFAFVALTAGVVAAGYLSDRFQRRKLMLIAAGLVNIPILWLTGQATAFWQLAVLTAIGWFFIGIGFAVVTILAGLFSGPTERGKVFGILAINSSLGALVGGALSGPIVDRWGYPTLFLIAALCWAATPLLALLLQDKVVEQPHTETTASEKHPMGGAFYLMLIANFIAFGAGFIALLARPLMMDQQGFDSTAISGVYAIGGLVSLPIPYLLGIWSDRVGRYGLIAWCFIAGAFGLGLLAVSTSLWVYGLSSVLLAGVGASMGVGSALVTDMVPAENLGTALALYNFAPTLGGIIGFVLTGYAIQSFGVTATLVGGAVLTVASIPLLMQVRRARRLTPGLASSP